ncbi:MAG: phosphoribosylformylglycinamidine synthase subunit PurL [Candidatus Kapabacteria bacterium]|nr:phosphoribosylformylglycinamidine synthase subunit PurL [Candidatus Kapabacteria bacterium]
MTTSELQPLLDNQQLYTEFEVNAEAAKELGLTEQEFIKICEVLQRKPTYTELGVYSVMWSEHCSYKNSILQLKTLPRSGGRMLVEAGEENAGLIDIGGGYAIAFKIESHNHPSAIEPVEGAATGVGGILRDIFTMGARPVAALNSLRFGELDSARTKYLLKGVVKGISHYGNAFGVPTVGGEIYFDKCYTDNPLVNAMAVGIVKTDQTASAVALGAGNPVMIMGSSTGRDGIHGASMASKEFDGDPQNMRPTVQVGDPFAEKLLLEATLELIQSGVVVGMQDMGAAGICCSTSEMSAKGEVGMNINLDLVPLREVGMSAYEIMLSESQERMLVVVEQGKEDIAKAICDKWDVPITTIGHVTDDGIIRIHRFGKCVQEIPAQSLVLGGGAPVYTREWKEAEYINETRATNAEMLSAKVNERSVNELMNAILTSTTVASKRWVYEQYDSQVGTNTMQKSGGDAAVMRIKELPGQGFAVSTDCNSRYVYLNPYRGGLIAVAEAARNCACVGAEPVAITNCLNFGNPYDPEVYWQFREAIRGMGDMCRALNTPVTGGNVSFHNESQNHAVFPTPTIGMLGLIDDVNKTVGSGFKNENDVIIMLGTHRVELGGSEAVKHVIGDVVGDAPFIDITEEVQLQKVVIEGIRSGLVQSAHDCAEGGLAIALAEKAIVSGMGATVTLPFTDDASNLFSEAQSRIVVTVAAGQVDALQALCTSHNVQCTTLGTVGGDALTIGQHTFAVTNLQQQYYATIPQALGIEA